MKVVDLKEKNGNGTNAIFDYKQSRRRYLSLCRKHGLNPFDLDILSISMSRLPRQDKTMIVSLILRLIRLERSLKEVIQGGLFPLTVQESERTGYLVPTKRPDCSSSG